MSEDPVKYETDSRPEKRVSVLGDIAFKLVAVASWILVLGIILWGLSAIYEGRESLLNLFRGSEADRCGELRAELELDNICLKESGCLMSRKEMGKALERAKRFSEECSEHSG